MFNLHDVLFISVNKLTVSAHREVIVKSVLRTWCVILSTELVNFTVMEKNNRKQLWMGDWLKLKESVASNNPARELCCDEHRECVTIMRITPEQLTSA